WPLMGSDFRIAAFYWPVVLRREQLQVDLIGYTVIPDMAKIRKYAPRIADDWVSTDADLLAEFAGRSCYQSFHKPNPTAEATHTYLKHFLELGRFSVREDASATLYVSGVSRALTHGLIRHRHRSYSGLSQRFVDLDEANSVIPPALRDEDDAELLEVMDACANSYNELVDYLTNVKGLKRKPAREAARAVMPNMTETRIVGTGHMRAWRDMLFKRYSVHADAEIREFAAEVLRQLKLIAPGQFQDFPEAPLE